MTVSIRSQFLKESVQSPVVRIRFIVDTYTRMITRLDFPRDRISQARILGNTLLTLDKFLQATMHCPYSLTTTNAINNLLTHLEKTVTGFFSPTGNSSWNTPVFTASAVTGVIRMIRKDALEIMTEQQLPKVITDSGSYVTGSVAYSELLLLSSYFTTFYSSCANTSVIEVTRKIDAVLALLSTNSEYILSKDSCAQLDVVRECAAHVRDTNLDFEKEASVSKVRFSLMDNYIKMSIGNLEKSLKFIDKL